MLGMQELIIILVIVVLLFGAKRIPEIMSGLGKGIRTFKSAMDGEEVSNSKPAPTISSSASSEPQPSSQSEGAKEKIDPK
jgi:sec-independent protein translocase protein TatA